MPLSTSVSSGALLVAMHGALHFQDQQQSRTVRLLDVCQVQKCLGLNSRKLEPQRSLFGCRVVRVHVGSGAVAFTPHLYCARRVTGTEPTWKGGSWTMPEHSTSVFTLIKWRRSKVQIQPLGHPSPRWSLLLVSMWVLFGLSSTISPKTCMLA